MVRSQYSTAHDEHPSTSNLHRRPVRNTPLQLVSTSRPTRASDQSTNELISMARLGSSHALRELYNRYTPFVYQICKRFFLPGADTEDLIQEGLTGIHHAIMTFAADRGRDFEDYASMCVRNQIVRSVRHATRRKHMVLTQAASLQAQPAAVDRPCNTPGPEEQVLGVMAMGDWLRLIATCLSDLEKEVLQARLQGESNGELANRLGVDRKQLENALFRARRKLTQAAQKEELMETAG